MATSDVIHVSTVDNLLKYVVSIDGCGSVDQMCERTTGLIGNISCSLLNTKPGIQLTFAQSESPSVTISREWHHTDENHSTNTFDNYVISEYHISQCDEVIELSCSPASEEIAKFHSTAVIHLKPDASECQVPKNGSSKTVTAVVIVIIVCVIMISVLAATFFIKRRGRSKREPGSSGMNMSQIESQDTDTADPKHNESTNTEHEKEPLLQGPLATDGEFQRLLIESKDLHKDTEVREFLGKSISNLNPSKEELLAIANFFSTSKWISHEGLVAVLQTVLEMKQIPSKVGLDIVMELFNKEKIKAEDVLKRLRVATTENKVPPATTAEMLTKYYVLNLLTTKDIDKSIHMGFSKPKEKVPFLYILLVIEELHSESENREKLIELFNAIVAKLKSDLEYNGEALSELKDLEEMDFRKAISSVIIFIVDSRMLDVDTLMDILQKRSLKEKVSGTLLTTVLFDLLQNEKIELYRYIAELKTCLVAHQISSSDFVQFLSAPLNDEKVCIHDFITEMQDCRHQNVITKEQYAIFLSSLLNYKQFKLDEFVKAYDEGWKRGIKIDEANFRSLMSNFLRQRKVKLEDYLAEVKKIKDECQITDEVFEKLLSVVLEYEEINVQELIPVVKAWRKEASISSERFLSFIFECAKCDKITDHVFEKLLSVVLEYEEINVQELIPVVKAWGKEASISSERLLSFFIECGKCDKINTQNILEEFKTCRREDFVNEETVFKFTIDLLKKDVVDKEAFCTFTMSLLKEGLVDKESFLTFTMSLLKEGLIDESTALPIIQSVIDKYKITKKDMANIKDVVDKKLYKKLQFHSDKGDK
ncbi:hypothetical protein BSL78_18747 [Apostichopus japonicus]|uniref:Uncharacterized protein n=1 Tax=Stichopus japonicus TaxID=307972 RepID=A0A2G8K8S3_STIJA|nr:hypothetical protein BSL78_18747 [Apostichopus japonicus]